MNNIIEMMLKRYNSQNNKERENAVKEIMQEIALSGLSHGGFFKNVAFYGGTCLRIFYGLNRFSEDLDFALLNKNEPFEIEDYFQSLQNEFNSFGLSVDIETKKKDNNADVKSAFIKANTLMLMMSFFPQSEEAKQIVSNQRIKIKFEIDIDNPDGGITENKYRFLPAPYEVQVFDESTLFAGKIHAILCRNYKQHVKGRDYYDYLFYIAKGCKLNIQYLENKLKNTGVIPLDAKLTLAMVKSMLKEKFINTDYESAKEDVTHFIDDLESIKLWKKELFLSTLDEIKTSLGQTINKIKEGEEEKIDSMTTYNPDEKW